MSFSSRISANTDDEKNNWIFNEFEMFKSPSFRDGVTPENESWLRLRGCIFISKLAKNLCLPKETSNIAKVILHRFYARNSCKTFVYQDIASTCLFLCSKFVADSYRKLKDFIVVCARLASKNDKLVLKEGDKEFNQWRDNLLYYEELVLEAITMDFDIQLPHILCAELVCKYNGGKKICKQSLEFCHDSLNTTLILRYDLKTVAAVAVYTACRQLKEDLYYVDEKNNKISWIKHSNFNEELLESLMEELVVSFDEVEHKKEAIRRATATFSKLKALKRKNELEDAVFNNKRRRVNSSLDSFSPVSTTTPNQLVKIENNNESRNNISSISPPISQPDTNCIDNLKSNNNNNMLNGSSLDIIIAADVKNSNNIHYSNNSSSLET
ncbi:hypothetical protein HK099_003586 [Clydaea vesicula]|uniref:Cyclin-like domain-containing protein n=1 Tax=Clydaea vesicula TaxID=447962 RepID=A0AAD5U1G6_9FUNG|nr:hypothetical protein HK099_003586 [Clydaea vesicula]